jgi:hypothetical protein
MGIIWGEQNHGEALLSGEERLVKQGDIAGAEGHGTKDQEGRM